MNIMNKLFRVKQTMDNEWEVSLQVLDLYTTVAIFFDKNMLNLFLKTIGIEEIE